LATIAIDFNLLLTWLSVVARTGIILEQTDGVNKQDNWRQFCGYAKLIS